MIRNIQPGIYHATNSGQATWFEFAGRSCAYGADNNALEPISPVNCNGPAPRPAFQCVGPCEGGARPVFRRCGIGAQHWQVPVVTSAISSQVHGA